jgi:hypothetical protein
MHQYNVGAPFERIATDIAEPFPASDRGSGYIMVAMVYFIKWPAVYAIRIQET